MTTAVDKWPAAAKLCGGRCGGPLTHSSYTTPRGTTFKQSVVGCTCNSMALAEFGDAGLPSRERDQHRASQYRMRANRLLSHRFSSEFFLVRASRSCS